MTCAINNPPSNNFLTRSLRSKSKFNATILKNYGPISLLQNHAKHRIMMSYQLSFLLCIGYDLIHIGLLLGQGKNHREKSLTCVMYQVRIQKYHAKYGYPISYRQEYNGVLEVPMIHRCRIRSARCSVHDCGHKEDNNVLLMSTIRDSGIEIQTERKSRRGTAKEAGLFLCGSSLWQRRDLTKQVWISLNGLQHCGKETKLRGGAPQCTARTPKSRSVNTW